MKNNQPTFKRSIKILKKEKISLNARNVNQRWIIIAKMNVMEKIFSAKEIAIRRHRWLAEVYAMAILSIFIPKCLSPK